MKNKYIVENQLKVLSKHFKIVELEKNDDAIFYSLYEKMKKSVNTTGTP